MTISHNMYVDGVIFTRNLQSHTSKSFSRYHCRCGDGLIIREKTTAGGPRRVCAVIAQQYNIIYDCCCCCCCCRSAGIRARTRRGPPPPPHTRPTAAAAAVDINFARRTMDAARRSGLVRHYYYSPYALCFSRRSTVISCRITHTHNDTHTLYA